MTLVLQTVVRSSIKDQSKKTVARQGTTMMCVSVLNQVMVPSESRCRNL